MNIAVAGASGYIGRALIPRLLEKFPDAQITALSRSAQDSPDPRVEWKACDLFSLRALEEALPAQVDLAFYLVHSMGPTAQLDQGTFADYDLILADNFARALKKLGPKHLLYLGGLIPPGEALSLHLQSRLEVEQTFRAHNLPLTVFRAGLILGESGSSFQILLNLVERLPVMVCPRWTLSRTTPVDLETVIETMADAAAGEEHIGKVYDLEGCAPLTYIDMMRETARRLGLKRKFFTVPFFTPTLSRLWVSLITGAPKALVYPLIESLRHDMLARADHRYPKERPARSYYDLLDRAVLTKHPGQKVKSFSARRRTVRSVQRLPLCPGRDAEWVKEEYARWLPRYGRPLIKVSREDDLLVFSVLTRKLDMLELQMSAARSDGDRQLLYIKGGLLSSRENKGRLEFRVVLNRRFVLAAIHDFRPSLPWFVYRYTQSVSHLLVMRAFKRHLEKITRRTEGQNALWINKATTTPEATRQP